MLVTDYELRLAMPKCSPFAERSTAIATLNGNVAGALPYLNAELEDAHYAPNAPALMLDHDGHHVSIWPSEILVAGCTGGDDARPIVDEVCALINGVWERRESIELDHRGYEELTVLEALKLLPGGNCRECGEVACLPFAMKLVKREVDLSACPPILTDAYAEQRRVLLGELLKRGYKVGIDA